MAKKIIDACVGILAALAVVVTAAFIWYKIANKDVVTSTTFVDRLHAGDKGDVDADNPYMLEINYYSNDAGNGVELAEIKFNYMTDAKTKTVYAKGVQYSPDLARYGMKNRLSKAQSIAFGTAEGALTYVDPALNYYDSYGGEGWASSGSPLGGKTMLQYESRDASTGDAGFYGLELSRLNPYKVLWWTNYHVPTVTNLLYDLTQAVGSHGMGYGDYQIPLDLSAYFTTYKYNAERKKYEPYDGNRRMTVITAQVHHDKSGALTAKDSIFGSINFDPTYGKADSGEDYWKTEQLVTLTAKHFDYTIDEGGYLARLSDRVRRLITATKDARIEVEIDLDDAYLRTKDVKLTGLAAGALRGVPLDRLTVRSASSASFRFLAGSLVGTGLTSVGVTQTVTASFAPDAGDGLVTAEVIA